MKYASLKRTRIVCTIGPASSSKTVLESLIKAGMNVARINFSHGSYESNEKLLNTVREAATAAGQPVAILQDLQGPRIRVGDLPGGGLELLEGKIVTLHAGAIEAEAGVIPVPYDRLAHDVKRGDRILLEDGTKELEVLDVRGPRIRAKVLLGGRLLSHKGINVPTAVLSAESMTEKDEHDLAFGLQHNIDFVALSFVRSADDVQELRDKIDHYLPKDVAPPAVIVKIEKHEAIVNFDAILEAADGVMIARGDLGLETPVSLLPLRQKEIIAKCVAAAKPVITATEMLASMEHHPRPTRAEVTDVANAVIDHTDAVMLSAETAMGRYPTRTVEMMAQIIRDTESSPFDNFQMPTDDSDETEALPHAMAAAALTVARRLKAKAIVVTTTSGYSARAICALRPEIPVFAATDTPRTYQQLLLSWGVIPLLIEGYQQPEQMVRRSLANLQDQKGITKGDSIVVVSGLKRAAGGYDSALRVVEL